MTTAHIKALRLLVGAAQWEAAGRAVPAEYVDQVIAARAELESTRGLVVVDAVLACQRSGLTLAMDFSPTVRETGEESTSKKHERIVWRRAEG